MKVLHVAAEIFPLIKTGGLADVVAGLPRAQAEQDADVRLLLPGFPAVLDAVQQVQPLAEIGACFSALRVRLLLARMPGSGMPVYVIDAPYLYRRAGDPYQDGAGHEWTDNLQRFALLGWVAAHLAGADADPNWSAEIVHAHDWHAGLACTYIADHAARTAGTVFTVHNLAFQGLFAMQDWPLLGLAGRHLSPAGLEFHGQLSFMKAGLQYADRIATVSPSYAREIMTPEFGCGLEGVIRSREGVLSGILNGIDAEVWNPATDPSIAERYDARRRQGKQACRIALQRELGLQPEAGTLIVAIISRLTAQKGLDLVLAALPGLLQDGVQLVLQGSGEPALESAFRMAQAVHPGRVHVHIGYDEARAHRLLAGADAILLPSRFEPCGLTQMYGLRYGTLPIVRRVGGLADSVIDAGQEQGNGFVFDAATATDLLAAVAAARRCFADARRWQELQHRAMTTQLSWAEPARRYLALYAQALADRATPA